MVGSAPGLLAQGWANPGDADWCALVSVVVATLLGGPANLSAAGLILCMLSGGDAMEDWVMRRAGRSLEQLVRRCDTAAVSVLCSCCFRAVAVLWLRRWLWLWLWLCYDCAVNVL